MSSSTILRVGVALGVCSLLAIYFKKKKKNTIPLVDLASSDAPKQIRDACMNHGFFYLINHGVSQQLIDSAFEQSRIFFALPIEEKQKYAVNKFNHGYLPLGSEILDPERQIQGDTKESFYIGVERLPHHAFPLHGPNIWPDVRVLPNFKKIMNRYFNALRNLGTHTTRLIAQSANLKPSFFDSCFTDPMALINLLHYPPIYSDPNHGIFGAGAHTDYGMLTILATDGVPGLQIFQNGEWVDVPSIPGAFIVNLGDMLQRWTNDVYKSTLHRVVNLTGSERYSIPFFFEPNFDTMVTCLPKFCSEENPSKYPPIKSGEYLVGRYTATQHNFTEQTKI